MLAVDLEEGDRTVVLRVRGELDLESRSGLASVTDDIGCLRRRERTLVIDLSGLEFCDVGGLGMLASIARAADEGGWASVVSGAPGIVRRVADVLEVDLRFTH